MDLAIIAGTITFVSEIKCYDESSVRRVADSLIGVYIVVGKFTKIPVGICPCGSNKIVGTGWIG